MSVTIKINAIDSNGFINGKNATGAVTVSGSATDTIAGALANQNIFVTLNGATYTGIIASNGTWSVSIGAAAVSALTDGQTYIVTAAVTDKNGSDAFDFAKNQPTIEANRSDPFYANGCDLNEITKEPAVEHARECLFIDPSVSDLDTIIGGLRSDVEAIVLNAQQPVVRQLLSALEERHDLSAIHVVAHGSPGRVKFTGGDWWAGTIRENAEDFAAIGRSLAPGAELRLWSCETAAGRSGAAFIAALSNAIGVDVAAATGRVGATSLGGAWEARVNGSLGTVKPPLTETGIALYPALFSQKVWSGASSTTWSTGGNWTPSGAPAAGDDVTIASTATQPILTSSTTINSLTMNGTSPGDTLVVSTGATLTVTSVSPGAATVNLSGSAAKISLSGTGSVTTNGGISIATGASIDVANGQLTCTGTNFGISNAGAITLAGGTVASAVGIIEGAGSTLIGFGGVSANISGNGTIEASGGGTLDLKGTVNDGLTLAIDPLGANTLKISGTATTSQSGGIGTNSGSSQTLEIGSGGSLTINANETLSSGSSAQIKLDSTSSTLTIGAGFGLTIGSGASLSNAGGTINATYVTITSGGTLNTAGGAINTSGVGGGIFLLGTGVLSGYGNLNATSSAAIGGSGTIKASGGTLDLMGTVNTGLTLAIDAVAGSVLKIDGTAVSGGAIDTSGQTALGFGDVLEVGANGNLTIAAAETVVGSGKIQLDGGTLTDAAGLTLAGTNGGAAPTLSGFGTVAAPLTVVGNGLVQLNGGTLIDSSGITFSQGGFLKGYGTVVGPLNGGPSDGFILAAHGTLELASTVNVHALELGDSTGNVGEILKLDAAAFASAVEFVGLSETLEIGPNASLTIGGFNIVSTGGGNVFAGLANGTIRLDGGTLTDPYGLMIGSGATLAGSGTVAANISGNGTIEASGGGTLDLKGTVNDGLTLAIDPLGANTLKISGTATTSQSGGIGTNSGSSQTLEIGSGGSLTINANETLSSGSSAQIKLDSTSSTLTIGAGFGLTIGSGASLSNAGGTINATYVTITSGGTLNTVGGAINTSGVGGGIFLLGTGVLSGYGNLNATSSAAIGGSGTIKASGGTLDLMGTVNTGLTLAIDAVAGSVLKIDGTAVSGGAIDTSGQTALGFGDVLEVGANGNLTIAAAETVVGSGKIQLDGGTLTDAAGLTLAGTNGGAAPTLSGFGTVAAPLTVVGNGLVQLNGGTLIDSSGITFSQGGFLKGYGTVVGPLNGGPSDGFILAAHGTLELASTVNVHALELGDSTGNVGEILKLDAAAFASAVEFVGLSETLEIGPNASLTIGGFNIVSTGGGNVFAGLANGTIRLDGGTLTDPYGLMIGSGATLAGSGTVAANIGSGSGIITASGGPLNLAGTVASGNAFTIDSASASTLKFSNSATAASAITINSVNQTLEIGASANLNISALESITNGKIQLDGGTLTDASGVTLGSGSHLVGFGVIGTGTAVGGIGSVTASGGTIEFKGSVDSTSLTSFDIANLPNSALKFDDVIGTSSITPTITFDGTNGGAGFLDLSSTALANFHGILSNFGIGEGIDVNNAASVSLDASGTVLTVFDSSQNSLGTIALATSYAGYNFSVSGGVISVSDKPMIAGIGDGGAFGGADHIVSSQSGDNTVTGTALKGSTVTLTFGAETLGTATSDVTGNWSYSLTASNIATIGEGTGKTISATDTHGGNSSTSTTSFPFVVDTAAPMVSVSLVADTGQSSTDQITSNAAISGTGDANAIVHFTVDGTAIGPTATANASGVWSFTPTGLTDGSHSVVASEMDTAGNVGASSALTFTLDSVLPKITSIAAGQGTPTNASTVEYLVHFSEPVTGVDPSQFAIAANGVTGAFIEAVDPVTGSGGTQYSVKINTGSGDGTVGLQIVGDNITDAAGNGLPGGTFAAPHAILSGGNPTYVATGDLNGDGKADLAITMGNSISVLLGNGDGTFAPATTIATGPSPDGLVIADVNGDHKADLVFGHYTPDGSLSVMLGNGDGTFQQATNYATQPYPSQALVADINGDGKADLAITDNLNTGVSVYLGTGDGTFGREQFTPTGVSPVGIAAADLNGDHKLDLVTADHFSNRVSILLGQGDGTFQAAGSVAASGPEQVRLGDLNGDGKADLVIANYTAGSVSVALGNGDGTFAAPVGYQVDSGQIGIELQDVNDDGALDIVVPNIGKDTLSVLLGKGDGTFQPESVYATSGGTTYLALADFNGDGRPDIAASGGNTVSILQNLPSTPPVSAYVIDKTAPAVTAALANDTGISGSDLITSDATLTGSGDANAVVHFTVDGTAIANTATADANGIWTYAPAGLSQGQHTIVASEADAAGNIGTALASFSLDTAPPKLISIVGSDASPTNHGNVDDVVTFSEPVSGVDASDFALVTAGVVGASITNVAAVAGSNGTQYTVSIATGSGDGSIALGLKAQSLIQDAAGNAVAGGVTTGPAYTIDKTAPAVTAALANDTGISGSDLITSDATLTGSGDANAVVHFTVDGTAIANTATADANGVWSYAPGGLTDGSHSIVASETDAAGNVGTSAALTFTLDSTRPSAPSVALHADNGSSNSDLVTNSGVIDVSGLETGGSWQYSTDNGAHWTTGTGTSLTLTGDGTKSVIVNETDVAGNVSSNSTAFNFTLDTTSPIAPTLALHTDSGSSTADKITNSGIIDVSGLETGGSWQYSTDNGANWANGAGTSLTLTGDGTKSVIVNQTDVAGNVSSDSTAFSFTLDTTIPVAPTLTLHTDSGSSATDKITNSGVIDVSGVENGASWQYSTDNGGHWSNGTGTSFTVTSDGTKSVIVNQTDVAGNPSSISTAYDFTLDTTNPVVPTLALHTDSGSSAADKITNSGVVDVSALETGGSWQYSIDNGAHWTNGTGTSLTLTGDGTKSVVVNQTDVAGNVSSNSTAFSFTLDTITPVAPALALHTDSGSSGNDKITNLGLLDVSGLETGAMWQYSTDNGIHWSNGTGTSFTLSGDGMKNVIVNQTDVAGNLSSNSTAYSFTLDTTGPVVPTLALHTDSGSSSSDKITNSGVIDVSGLETAGSWQYSTDSGGHWTTGTGTSFTLTGDGTKSVIVHQTDVAGNVSSNSTAFNFTLDTTSPVVPALALHTDSGSSATDKITNSGVIDVSGLETGGSWQYSADNGAHWINGTGTSFTLTGDGTKSVIVHQTDVAGNLSSNSTAYGFTLDTTSPTVPALALHTDSGSSGTDKITNSGVIDVSGLETGANWQYSTDSGAHWTNGTGTSFTLTGDGAKNAIVHQSDVAGNTSTSSGPLTFTLDTTAPVTTISDMLQVMHSKKATTTTISGTSEGSSTVTLLDHNIAVQTVKADASGNWSAALSNVTDTIHTYTAKAVDLAGNQGITSMSAILGSSRGDKISGTGSADLIEGLGGADKLTAGAGSDTFVFHASFGKDSIGSFDLTTDVLAFDHSLFASVTAILNATRDVKGNAVIAFDAADTVTLTGLTKADLSAHLSSFHII